MLERKTILPAVLALVLSALFMIQAPSAEGARAGEEPVYEELYINHFGVKGNINHNYAVTELSQQFTNPGEDAVEAGFMVQIPQKAFISNFSLEVDGVTYYGEVLLDWIVERLANQKGSPDTPLEDVGALMVASGHPEHVLIGIGATRYTPLGESTFLKQGDQANVRVYDSASGASTELRQSVR